MDRIKLSAFAVGQKANTILGRDSAYEMERVFVREIEPEQHNEKDHMIYKNRPNVRYTHTHTPKLYMIWKVYTHYTDVSISTRIGILIVVEFLKTPTFEQ